MARWAVVGGGVLGLSLAHQLSQRGEDVTLIEAAPELGGLAAAWQIGDVVWDRHYHVILLSDQRTRALLADVGLDDELQWVETKTGYYGTDNVLRSVSDTVEFLKLPGLSLLDKLRLGGTIFYGSKIRKGTRMETLPVDQWLRRWSGKRTYERFWLPLLRAKLGDAYQQASAAFIWATDAAAVRGAAHRPQEGDVRLRARWLCPHRRPLRRGAGGRGRQGRDVAAGPGGPPRHADGLDVHGVDGAVDRFDQVVVTAAGPLAADLCPDLTRAEQARLRAVRVHGRRVRVAAPRAPAGALLPHVHHRPRHPVHGRRRDDAVRRPGRDGRQDAGVPAEVRRRRTIRCSTPPTTRSGRPSGPTSSACTPTYGKTMCWPSRSRGCGGSSPCPRSGSPATMPPMETSVPGLHLVGSAQLPFATLNVNDTLGLVGEFMEGLDP